MAGLVPAIHVFLPADRSKTWMPGTRPGMTVRESISNGAGTGSKVNRPQGWPREPSLLVTLPLEPERDVHAPVVVGLFWALVTVAIWGAWPVYTRLSVLTALTPQDLVALRYGIGGLILLPVLVRLSARLPAF